MVFAFQDNTTPGTGAATSQGAALAQQYNIPLTAPGTGPGTSFNPADQSSYQDPQIYIGRAKVTKNTNATVAESPFSGTRLKSQQQTLFAKSGEANIRHWALLLALTGFAGVDPTKAAEWAKTAPLTDVLNAHDKFLTDAAEQFGLYNRQITPDQRMKELLRYQFGNKWDGKLTSVTPDKLSSLGGAASLAGTTKQTSKSIDYLNPEDAKGMVRNMLQQQLGRDPSQAEYEDFVATIHAAERANPSTSTTTTTTDAQGNAVNQNTVTHSGLNSQGYDQLLYDKAKSMPSWAVWQAVGTYAPALFQALDAPVSGV